MRCTTFLLLFSIVTFLSAQNYLPLIQDNARWQVAIDEETTNGDFDVMYEYILGQDTVVNDTFYTSIWKQEFYKTAGEEGFDAYIQPFQPIEQELFALIREESSLRKVFCRFIEDDGQLANEIVLYNYVLNIGDSWFDNNMAYTVTDLTTQFLYGQERRVWTFDNNVKIFEGIGSELGLFEGITPTVNGSQAQLYNYCTVIAMDCNVAVDGMVNNRRKFNILNTVYGHSSKTYEYRFMDTIMRNGHTYFELFRRQAQEQPEYKSEEVFFREEHDHVYRIDGNYGDDEILIYDFSMGIGDSITYYTFSREDSLLLYVNEIDTITLLNNEQRLRFRLNSFSNEWDLLDDIIWIKGIGATFDPFYPGRHEIKFFLPELYLHQCFYNDFEQEPIYSNALADACYSYVVNTEETKTTLKINLYPNPASTSLQLSSTLLNGQLILYDLFGQEQQRYTTDNETIDISNLPAACYFYQIINKELRHIQQGKLIKSKH